MAKPQYNGAWPKIRAQVLRRDGYQCQIKDVTCTTYATSVDHIIPIQHGGDHSLSNLRAACIQCNSRKGAGHYPPTRKW